ncbi:hypothetical protein KIH74_18620 [Kineosporia sp. J2-2]|uniref:Uncharacterized protein n=1 Tax=Kineosporia corallincola TaxID=2835133 RepID=A0ABS5TIN1_9ACTN|nr:hypothetical protein [Kineosporia corallincola]MBT0770959.1 hypothetical protein [Kineosporia corallincola]
MDMRIGGQPLSSARIALTSPDPDANPAGSQGQAWSYGAQSSGENSPARAGFDKIADGDRNAVPVSGDVYLTAMYEQYVNYRGPKRGTVENPLSPAAVGPVQTVVITRTEGTRLDIRV